MALLPPFLAVESEPLDAAQLDEFAEAALMIAAEDQLPVGTAVAVLVGQDEEVPDQSPAQRWQITGTDTADWAMRKLAEVEHKRRAAVEQAEQWRERIDAWLAHEADPLEARAAFFAHHLEYYALALREADPKAKSLSLPSGTVRTREAGPRVVVTDEEAAIKWAKSSLPLEAVVLVVRTSEKIMVSELKSRLQTHEVGDGFWAAVDEDGAVVPGVEVEPPSVSAKAVPDVE